MYLLVPSWYVASQATIPTTRHIVNPENHDVHLQQTDDTAVAHTNMRCETLVHVAERTNCGSTVATQMKMLKVAWRHAWASTTTFDPFDTGADINICLHNDCKHELLWMMALCNIILQSNMKTAGQPDGLNPRENDLYMWWPSWKLVTDITWTSCQDYEE